MLFEAVVGEISTYAEATDSEASSEQNLRRILVRWAWENERFIYNEAFREFVDSIMATDGVE